jgi:hypothetical protein
MIITPLGVKGVLFGAKSTKTQGQFEFYIVKFELLQRFRFFFSVKKERFFLPTGKQFPKVLNIKFIIYN